MDRATTEVENSPPSPWLLGHALLGIVPLLGVAMALGLIARRFDNSPTILILLPNALAILGILGLVLVFRTEQRYREALFLYTTMLLSVMIGGITLQALNGSVSPVDGVGLELGVRLIFMGLIPVFLVQDTSTEPIDGSIATLVTAGKYLFAAFVPIFALSFALMMLFQALDIISASNAKEMADLMRSDERAQVLIPVAVSLAAPLYEEIFFRFLIFKTLRNHTNFVFAAIVSGSIFGLAHGSPILIPVTACLGVLFAWAYEKTGSILAPIAMHVGWNTVSLALTVGFAQ